MAAERHPTIDKPREFVFRENKMSNLKKSISGSNLIFTLVLGMMFLLSWAGNTAADENTGQDFFELGNKAYVNGNYDQAIIRYKAALDREGYTSSLLYNLANAYYMKNEMGQSILNYERALYLDPGNAHIKSNLALARKKAGLVQDGQASWIGFFKRFTLNEWTWAGAVALCFFSMMILLKGIRPGIFRGNAFKTMICLCLLFFMAAGTGMVLQYGNLNRGVIIAANAPLRVSPFDSAAESGVINNGKMVQLAKTYEGYIFINKANGQSGWIPEEAVKKILPHTGNRRTQTSLTPSTFGSINGNGGEPGMNKT
jgi:tetratricopeptide (TPR) repeat protein